MKTVYLLVCLLITSFSLQAQTIGARLDAAVRQLESDKQLRHGTVSLYVINTKTGQPVYNRNGETGMATGSTLKVITSTTALDLLGTNYRYKTEIGYDGTIKNGILDGNVFIVGYGDPTLGSWRYTNTTSTAVMNDWVSQLKKAGITSITGDVYLDASKFSFQPIPEGWIWDDIGNYYGAGTWALNWHENQFDLIMKPGDKQGDDVQIVRTEPALQDVVLFNFLKTGKKGSGDSAIIYLAPYSSSGFVNGTVPAGEKQFKISGSFPNPVRQLEDEFRTALKQNNISVAKSFINSQALLSAKQSIPKPEQLLYTYYSPSLDSINYWFLRKSINLYGETLMKTLGLEKRGLGSLANGLKVVQDYWKDKGLEADELAIKDGSGLSPENRVTTKALTTVMQSAVSKPWYASFYNALPEYNGLKMKSGTIRGVKSFAGYITSKDGTKYTFAFIVNNYNGPSSEMVARMYKVLDNLK